MSSKSDMYDKYGDIIPDGYTVSDKTKEMLNKRPIDWRIPDVALDYKSPIELIAGNLQTRIENDAVKVVQSYGFNVDKAELEKALKYDRDQYDKGYAAGSRNVPRWIPVVERLPEESLNSVIGWDIYRKRCVFVQYIDGHFQIMGSDESFHIVAWMPLPEPYEEDNENE